MQLISTEAERICIDRMVKGQENPFTSPEGLAAVDSRMASLVSGPHTAIHARPNNHNELCLPGTSSLVQT